MEIGSLVVSLIGALAIGLGSFQSDHEIRHNPAKIEENQYSAKLRCKTGFKPGKTPISLVLGAKPGCYNVASAAAGKKLLTSDKSKSCFSCHSNLGIAPATRTNSNLRAQGYTLKPASLNLAFNAHVGEMAGAYMSPKDAKAISNYLQSIK